jgi:hypothetical protein
LQFLKHEVGNVKSEGEGGDPKLLEAIREAITSHQEMLDKLIEIVTEDQRDIASFKNFFFYRIKRDYSRSSIASLVSSNASIPA